MARATITANDVKKDDALRLYEMLSGEWTSQVSFNDQKQEAVIESVRLYREQAPIFSTDEGYSFGKEFKVSAEIEMQLKGEAP